MDIPGKEQGICEATMQQLGRMRAMQYAYHRKFFAWIALVFVLLVALVVFGGDRGLWLVPFVVVTAGVQAAFFLHFCDFARVHAQALEAKINTLLGTRVLMGAELEADYFYPLPAARIAGFVPSDPLSFFSVYTLHWCALWAAAFAGSLWAVLARGDSPDTWVLAGLAVAWAAINGGYVAWYFLRGKATRRMAAQLGERLHRQLD